MTTVKKDNTAELAESITWAGSKQTYYTAKLLVDRDLVDDFYRAYAYFRWIDDVIDISSRSDEERSAFIKRQKELIDYLYGNYRPDDLALQEQILADLIHNDRGEDSGLQSFIYNMFAMIEFDALRKGRLISQSELNWYIDTLAKSVTDGLLYFVGNGHPYPDETRKYLAGTAAHITHLLRDMHQDIADGFINIPREYLDQNKISHQDHEHPLYQKWVQERVEIARKYFCEGKAYLDELDVLRCKIVGHWYSARFEVVLDTIEHDEYILRQDYHERRRISTWLKMVWLGVTLTIQHFIHRKDQQDQPDCAEVTGRPG
jgi:phytoene/squalene synthetase